MNLKMDYDSLKKLYEDVGADIFLKTFTAIYNDFKLYTMPLGWLESREFILKFKGASGDIIFDWK